MVIINILNMESASRSVTPKQMAGNLFYCQLTRTFYPKIVRSLAAGPGTQIFDFAFSARKLAEGKG